MSQHQFHGFALEVCRQVASWARNHEADLHVKMLQRNGTLIISFTAKRRPLQEQLWLRRPAADVVTSELTKDQEEEVDAFIAHVCEQHDLKSEHSKVQSPQGRVTLYVLTRVR